MNDCKVGEYLNPIISAPGPRSQIPGIPMDRVHGCIQFGLNSAQGRI